MALLADYLDRLAAQHTFGVLLVLQGIDAAGKDGTIKYVMSGVNPQGGRGLRGPGTAVGPRWPPPLRLPAYGPDHILNSVSPDASIPPYQ